MLLLLLKLLQILLLSSCPVLSAMQRLLQLDLFALPSVLAILLLVLVVLLLAVVAMRACGSWRLQGKQDRQSE